MPPLGITKHPSIYATLLQRLVEDLTDKERRDLVRGLAEGGKVA